MSGEEANALVEELRYGAEYGCDADLIERAADAIEELVADLGDADAMTEMWMRKYEALQAQLPKRGEWLERVEPASPWHRVEEEPRDGQECIVAYLGPTYWIYEHAVYHSDLNKALEEDIFIEGTDGFIVDSDVGYARHGLFKYWMPIEPPKEEE